ncbi:MAG: hypothetical protein H0T70_06935 [Acidimicrobiia bacterium]|nr:hypothetical protein [Acidimicrobiia bacterium]
MKGQAESATGKVKKTASDASQTVAQETTVASTRVKKQANTAKRPPTPAGPSTRPARRTSPATGPARLPSR